jgi:hypothetical protein
MPKLLDWTETLDIRKKNGMMINKIRDIVRQNVNALPTNGPKQLINFGNKNRIIQFQKFVETTMI